MAIEIRITVGPSGVSILAGNPGTQDGGNPGQVTGGVNFRQPQAGGGGGPQANPGPGGGAPSSGALVIGPIVLDASCLSGTSQAQQSRPKVVVAAARSLDQPGQRWRPTRRSRSWRRCTRSGNAGHRPYRHWSSRHGHRHSGPGPGTASGSCPEIDSTTEKPPSCRPNPN